MSTIHKLPETAQVAGEGNIRRVHFDKDTFIDEWIQDYTGECSFCGLKLEPPSIVWSMVTGTLWLHIDCCSDLGLSLVKDAARTDYVHRDKISSTVAKLTDRIPA